MKMGFDSRQGAAEVVFTEAERAERPPAPAITDLAAHFPELEIRELVAQGGMGCVYRARQISLNRDVALKILTVGKDDPSFAGRFEREARTLAGLSHPGIVSVFDFGQRGPWTFLVMEFVEGASLRQMMRARTLGPRESLSIVTQICDALQFAHDQGVVHRDIKPENVLVTREGRVKVLDFGLAKLVRGPQLTNLTQTRQVMGTPHYMAPEQWEKPASVDHRADIYALGVVFYELLTGELPMGRFAPPSHKVAIDVRLDDVVLRSLEKEPELRYQHASEVKTSVEGIAATPGAATASEPTKERKFPRVAWIAVPVGCLFLAIPVLLVGGLLVYGGKRLDTAANEAERALEIAAAPAAPSSELVREAVHEGVHHLEISDELARRMGLDQERARMLNAGLRMVWQRYLALERQVVRAVWLQDGWLELTVRDAQPERQVIVENAAQEVWVALAGTEDSVRWYTALRNEFDDQMRFGRQQERMTILVDGEVAHIRSGDPRAPKSELVERTHRTILDLWERMLQDRPRQPK
jgi:predicted Ser/Thr protein kinase